MDKKIRIITHTDFDGAAFPHFLGELLEIYGLKNGYSIEYGDINNAFEIISKDFEHLKKLSYDELQNIFYIVHDIASIGDPQKVMPLIRDMQNLGIKFSYIDHHISDDNKYMNGNLECMYYSSDQSMCASMIGYATILKCFADAWKMDGIDEFLKFLQFKDDDKELLKENIQMLHEGENFKKASYQKKFFADIFNFGMQDMHNGKVKKLLKESFGLIKGADFIDRGKVDEMHGLPVARDYFNLAIEHSPESLETILSNIRNMLGSDNKNPIWPQIKGITDDLSKKHKQKERVEEANKNVDFIKIYGSSGKKYNTAVFFAGGDIRYDIERNRKNMNEIFETLRIEPFRTDMVITATRFTIGQTPIMTLRRTNTETKILDIAQDTFKQRDLICGTDAGLPVEYAKDTYALLCACANYVVQHREKSGFENIVSKEREKIKQTLRSVLREHFDFEIIRPKEIRKRKETMDIFDI